MMNLRKCSAWGLFLIVAALAIFSWLGSPMMFVLYAVLMLPILVVHPVSICKRCDNLACAINPKSPDYFLSLKPGEPVGQADADKFSDLRMYLGFYPMVLAIIIGFAGVWYFNKAVFMALAVFSVAVLLTYMSNTCRYCTNNCPVNRNASYRAWKRSRADKADV